MHVNPAQMRARQFGAITHGGDPALRLDLACLQVGRILEPRLDALTALTRLDQLAAEVAAQWDDRASLLRGVNALCIVLFRHHHFRGDTETYYEPNNCCMHRALDTEQGMPITLAVIMLEVGRRVGLPLHGVGAPFHFLVKYEDELGEHYLDPFHAGRAIDREQLASRMRQTNPGAGPSAEAFLSSVTKRQILQRILTNLKGACVRKRQFPAALETSEFLLALTPWSLDERRDRGLLHYEVGAFEQALEDLELYQEHVHNAPDANRVAAILERVRTRLSNN